MDFKVVSAVLFIDGVKHTRGSIVPLSEADAVQYGVKLEPAPTPEPKKRATRKKASNEASE